VVCDGFVGNVVLKLSEGLVEAAVTMLKDEIKQSFLSKIGYLLARSAFKNFKKKVDYSEYGGAPLLGIDGVAMICHGGSNAKAVKNAIHFAHDYALKGVNQKMAEKLQDNFAVNMKLREVL
jgi:glycerol-3-phosphate acyltransferase PlsX